MKSPARSGETLDVVFQAANELKEVIRQAVASGSYTLKAIAAVCGVHYSKVSRAVKRGEARASF